MIFKNHLEAFMRKPVVMETVSINGNKSRENVSASKQWMNTKSWL